MSSIVFDFSFILHNQFVDFALIRLHFRDPFNPNTRFRPRRHRRSPRGHLPRLSRSAFRGGVIALVQIRKREERRQQHNFKTLPIFDVKPLELVERLRCGPGGELDVPVQIIV